LNRSSLLYVITCVNPDADISRRTVLATGLAGAGALTLAACSSGQAPGRPNAKAPAAPADVSLVKLDDITVGEAVSAKLADNSPVLVARPTSTTAACFSAICTHMGCTVLPAGKELHCPCHGSVYNAVTGAVIHGPAPRALPPVAVHVAGGQVVTGS
jgi:Rieske Fe-S protein